MSQPAKSKDFNYISSHMITQIKYLQSPWDSIETLTPPLMLRSNRDHFVCAPSQWETTLHCNVVSHWLGAHTKWSLGRSVRSHGDQAVNSPHKDQWRGALMFSLICAWMNRRVNTRDAGDLRRHRGHYDVTVIYQPLKFLRYLQQRKYSAAVAILVPIVSATRLFVKQLFQIDNKENIKAPYSRPFLGAPRKEPEMGKLVPCHHTIMSRIPLIYSSSEQL